jgi:hypothetical protein
MADIATKTPCLAIAESTTAGENGIGTQRSFMADDDELPSHATARPPPGEEDVYSASTVAGAASDEMLAIIRGESQRAFPGAPGLPKNLDVKAKSDPKVPAAPEAKSEPKIELKPTAKPPPPTSASASKLAYTATPLDVPVTDLAAASEPADADASPRVEDAGMQKSTMHPAVGIILFFVAVLAVLAALIR